MGLLLRARRASADRDRNYGNCVEVAFAGNDVLARDSKDRARRHLVFGQLSWLSFVRGVDSRFS
ncbi:DUF397 domain-containing protein [Saccharopolyspora sp. ID03-671]|uniref:DUF397 domain-containing protein n=1 Tax=Saccharopolyspora sp. ID03-671 TaxID=3073066 RepID=UPI0032563CF6